MAGFSIIKSFDYFFVLRPILFMPGWATLLAGYLIVSKGRLFFNKDEIFNQNWLEISLLLTLFACAMGASFLLNQIRDIESDLKNNKLFFLSEKHISIRAAIIETLLLATIAIIIAFKFNEFVVADTILFIFITGYAYNYKPMNLKDKPWGSVAANLAMGLLAFAIGWHSLQIYNGSFWIDVLPYLFFNTALYFFTLLPDVPGDRMSNKQTLAVLKGEKFVINISTFCFIFAMALALIFMDIFAIIFMSISFPFFMVAFFRKEVSAAIRATKYGIFLFAVAVGIKLPYFLIILLAIFIFTKWYYKLRFDYNYPNFKGE